MPVPTTQSFNFSKEKIIEMCSWLNFEGFTATHCKCGKKANVLAGNAGWICVCGEFNALTLNQHIVPWKSPNLGPTKSFIQEAVAEYRKLG